MEYTDGFVDIEIISKSLEHLTPGYCKNTFAAMLMYDSSNWLDTHAKSGEFKTCKIPEITLYIPSIYFGTPPSATIIEEYKKIGNYISTDERKSMSDKLNILK
jgi:hypothetical protein